MARDPLIRCGVPRLARNGVSLLSRALIRLNPTFPYGANLPILHPNLPSTGNEFFSGHRLSIDTPGSSWHTPRSVGPRCLT